MYNERRDEDWVNPPDDDERDDYEPDVTCGYVRKKKKRKKN